MVVKQTENKQASAHAVPQKAVTPAELIVNNKFVDDLSNQLKVKQEYGLTFPPDYNPTNALMGAYLQLKETNDKNGKCVLETCSQASIANSLMEMVTKGLICKKSSVTRLLMAESYSAKYLIMVGKQWRTDMEQKLSTQKLSMKEIPLNIM